MSSHDEKIIKKYDAFVVGSHQETGDLLDCASNALTAVSASEDEIVYANNNELRRITCGGVSGELPLYNHLIFSFLQYFLMVHDQLTHIETSADTRNKLLDTRCRYKLKNASFELFMRLSLQRSSRKGNQPCLSTSTVQRN